MDKVDESTGWAILGRSREACDVEKIDGLNWRRQGENMRIGT